MSNTFSQRNPFVKWKKTTLAIVLIFVMTSCLVFSLPLVNAHDPPWTIPTYAYVVCSPDTVGVGESTLIAMWVDMPPPTAGGIGGDRWHGFKVDITKPDGTKQTIGPIDETGQVGTAWVQFTPDQVGDYSVVFSWPGQTLTYGIGKEHSRGDMYLGDYFEGATSNPTVLHVQQQKTADWVEPPLPAYWTRPIPTANRAWAQLASSYLRGSEFRYSDFQEWGTAPNSAHILYAKPILNGGIANEYYGAVKYDTTDYENFFGSPIVMSGKIYYNALTYPNYGYYCVDLQTGQTLWYKNGTDNGLNNPVTLSSLGSDGPALGQQFPQLSFGQLYHYYSLNGEGIKDHLWMTQSGTPQTARSGGTMWHMLDANTGNWVMSLKNVPGGTSVTDQNGNLLLYSYNANTGTILAWNVSQAIPPPSPTGTAQAQWEPRIGAVIDAVNDTSWTQYGVKLTRIQEYWEPDDILPRSGYTMNVTGPKGLPGLNSIISDQNRVPKIMFFGDTTNSPLHKSSDMIFHAAALSIDYHVAPYSPFPDKSFTQNNNLGYGVTLLWNKDIQKPLGGNLTFSFGPISYEEKVFTLWSKETMQYWGYSLDTGEMLWGPTKPQGPWAMYGNNEVYAYGNIYTCGYGGDLNCYDIKTGTLKWTYLAQGIGKESPYGNYPLEFVGIADGKIYLYSSEHSPTQPLWRGSYLRAVDAINGHEIWKSLNFVSGAAIADGCIVAGNSYDNRMYVYGKGPSATTVTIQNDVITKGSTVLIKGTVTDQSPGARDTPAISDSYMSAWMDYLYMKQNIPGDAFGVPVKLTAIDTNGAVTNIGSVTSDMSGMFKTTWNPPTDGTYTVIATFEGTNSYGPSYAQTALAVTPAPTVETAKTTNALTPETFYVFAAIIVIMIVVLAVLMLRKK